MATLTLTIVGGVIGNVLAPGVGGYIGGAIGAAAGSAIDTYVIYPAIFPPEPIRAGRIKDLQYQQGDPGGSVPICIGPSVRVNSTAIIYLSTVRYRRRNVSSGGGPGKGATSTAINFYDALVDIAVGVCEPISHSTGIVEFTAIFADGKTIFQSRNNFDQTQPTIAFKRRIVKSSRNNDEVGFGPPDENGLVFRAFGNLVEFTQPAGSPADYSQLRAGVNVIISGAVNTVLNGTFTPYATGKRSADGSTFFYVLNDASVDLPSMITEPALRVFQVGQTFDRQLFEGITFYRGTSTQPADPIIQAALGAANAPGYPGLAYFVISNLAVDPFGHIPNIQVLVKAHSTLSIKDACELLMLKSGMAQTDYDVQGLVGIGDVDGILIDSPRSIVDALSPLMVAYDLNSQEVNGKLRLFQRSRATVVADVPETDLGASGIGEGVKPPLDFDDGEDFLQPSEVNVRYFNPGNNFQTGSQKEVNFSAERPLTTQVDLPLVMSDAKARAIAKRLLWGPAINRQQVKLSLPPKYFHLLDGDQLKFTHNGRKYTVLVMETAQGVNGVMEIQAAIDSSTIYAPFGTELSAPIGRPGVPAVISFEVLDLAPLRDRDGDVAGFYYAAANFDINEPYQPVTVFFGLTDLLLEQVDIIPSETTMGETVVTTLPLPEVVVDQDAASITKVGTWQLFTSFKAVGGTYEQAETGPTSAAASFTFEPTISVAGEYEIFYHLLVAGDARTFTWEVAHDGGLEGPIYTQPGSASDDTWVSLGRYNFTSTIKIVFRSQQTLGSLGVFSVDAIKYNRLLGTELKSGKVGVWDMENKLTVRLYNGALESFTDNEIYEGRNHCMIGAEVVAFRDAVLTGENTYELSYLLRGLRNTEWAVGSHAEIERFVLVDPASLRFRSLDLRFVDTETRIKAVAPGEDPTNIPTQSFVFHANNIRPFSPAALSVIPDPATGDFKIQWYLRSRKITRVLNLQTDAQPAGGSSLKWRIRFLVDGLLKRTTEQVDTDNYNYTATNQGEDGLTSGKKLTVLVQQLLDDAGSMIESFASSVQVVK